MEIKTSDVVLSRYSIAPSYECDGGEFETTCRITTLRIGGEIVTTSVSLPKTIKMKIIPRLIREGFLWSLIRRKKEAA